MSHAPTLAAGALLGPFRIDTPRADGSFGATDTRSGGRAVLRVFAADGWSAEERARFGERAEAAARVPHPNLAALLGAGSEDGFEWIACEALAGEPLAALLAQRGTPPAPLALRIVAEAAAGLAAAHGAGIAHGEVHPGTLFLARGEEGGRMRVKVLGLGGRTGGAVRSAAARYSSPETLRREEPAPAGDVFSLGVVAYELLAALPPQWGATLAALARGQAPLIPAPPVPEPLAHVVLRALHANPAARWPDAASFAAALASASAPVRAPATISAPGWTISAPAAPHDAALRPAPLASDPPAELPAPLSDDPPAHLPALAEEPAAQLPAIPADHVAPALPAPDERELASEAPRAPEPAPERLAYVPTRAPRFIPPRRGPSAGAIGGALLALLLTGVLAWAATRGAGTEAVNGTQEVPAAR